ncbi:FTR1 family iron permease [Exiguobacterium artemiae]|uniref:FTR1 family iron permease n=1 Tax=Exiguobacterium artemiae TaxID=340145 RepID=UPI00296534BD|nr:FTR1 family protein [Exiguobacterium sibiricum]MDW2885429.1 FTR1 family protein [Exiguobacterium sibiricum]
MRSLLNVFLALFLFTAIGSPVAHADSETDALYVSIGQALSAVNNNDRSTLETTLTALEKQIDRLPASAEQKVIQQRLTEVQKQTTLPEVRQRLTELSTAVRTLEETGQPKTDPVAKKRLTELFGWTKQLRQATTMSERQQLQSDLLQAWTDRETVVRETSIGHYGQVEMGLSAIRIALARETIDRSELNAALDQFDASIRSFLQGDTVQAAEQTGLSELTALLKQADQQLAAGNVPAAQKTLTTFIERWPSGEGEVRTRSSSLYTTIESEVPVLLSRLDESTVDSTRTDLAPIITSLQVLAQKTTYSFVDAMLVMLREGLEALLIISALVAFTRKAKMTGERMIWSGALFGLLASGALALVIQQFFSTALAAVGREQIEGWTGLVAVLMMLLVGSWLHSKTAVASRQTGLAMNLAGRSLFAVSFLTIFREGAETLLFYVGMAPAMTTTALAGGIILAIGLIGICSLAVIYFGVRLPISRLFLAATGLIYLMAFKILGASLHALQLTGIVPMHAVSYLPSVSWIGFYPTYETMLPQILLGLVVGLTLVLKRRPAVRLRKAG